MEAAVMNMEEEQDIEDMTTEDSYLSWKNKLRWNFNKISMWNKTAFI